MHDKRILGLLIALTKEIKLIKPLKVRGYEEKFIAGNESPFIFAGGIGIDWWYTDKGFKLCNSIASMSVEKYEQLKDGDKDKLSEVIKDAFRAICLNAEYFNSNDVFLKRKRCLFDARAINDVDIFSNHLWSYLLNNMGNSIGYWFFVYPLPRLITESFELVHDKISLIKKNRQGGMEKI